MKAQAVALGAEGEDATGQMGRMQGKATLEINADHDVVAALARMVVEDKRGQEEEVREFGRLLYDIASLTSGHDIEEPGDVRKRIISVMNNR